MSYRDSIVPRYPAHEILEQFMAMQDLRERDIVKATRLPESTINRTKTGYDLPDLRTLITLRDYMNSYGKADGDLFEDHIIANRLDRINQRINGKHYIRDFQEMPPRYWQIALEVTNATYKHTKSSPLWVAKLPKFESMGEYLCAIRHCFGLSAKEVAERVKCTAPAIQAIENGRRSAESTLGLALEDFYLALQKEQLQHGKHEALFDTVTYHRLLPSLQPASFADKIKRGVNPNEWRLV